MGNQLGGVFCYNLEVNSSYERSKEWGWKGKKEGGDTDKGGREAGRQGLT